MEPLTKMQRRVLATVKEMVSLEGFPPVGAVGRKLRKSPSTITEHIQELERKGFVLRVRRGGNVVVQPLENVACPWCGKPA